MPKGGPAPINREGAGPILSNIAERSYLPTSTTTLYRVGGKGKRENLPTKHAIDDAPIISDIEYIRSGGRKGEEQKCRKGVLPPL